MTLGAGTKLGPYEVVSSIGAGGMGEVYRARDPRLGRDVAIKVLPASLSSDLNRLRRFEQEARASAALNHPNILAIFDIGEADGAPYVVSEVLEGESFAFRLRHGPLPPSKAIALAQQVACGLAAAHEKGIVHRDLKPDNLFFCRDGRAKILDFGLAKLERPEQDGPTMTAVTEAGVTLGTVGYMSPEQVRGEAADARSDIFSFGAVLYEMLGGRRAFSRPTSAETMAAILNDDPQPLNEICGEVPPAADRIVRHCLEKQRDERFQSARDLAFALGSLSTPATGSQKVVTEPPSSSRPWIATGVSLVVLAVVLGWLLLPKRTETLPQAVRFSRLTDIVGLEEYPSLSPDGKYVAFTSDVSGTRQVMIQLLSGGAPLQITKDVADHQSPRWFPDSSTIIYYTAPPPDEIEGALWLVPTLGGAPRRLGSSLSDGDISRDDKHIAYFALANGKTQLKVAALDGSEPKVLREFPLVGRYMRPRWSPDGQFIAFQRGEWPTADIFIIPAEGGDERALTTTHIALRGFGWLADNSGIVVSSAIGSTVFYRPTMNLWLVPVNGSPMRQLTFSENSLVEPDVGRDGQVVASRLRVANDLWKFPVTGSPAANVRNAVRIGHQTGVVQTPSLSPDGKQIVYLADTGGHGNLWICASDGSNPRQITFERDPDITIGVPVWSPDGNHIVFVVTSTSKGWINNDNWIVGPDGSNPHLLVKSAAWASWSHDGTWIYYSENPGAEAGAIRKTPVDGGAVVEVRPLAEHAMAPTESPDGKTLYFATVLGRENGILKSDVRSATPPTGASRHLVTIPGSRLPWGVPAIHPIPSPDGKWLGLPLHGSNADELWGISTSNGELKRLTDFGGRRTFIARRVSWSPDSKFLFAAVGDGDADIVEFEGLLTH